MGHLALVDAVLRAGGEAGEVCWDGKTMLEVLGENRGKGGTLASISSMPCLLSLQSHPTPTAAASDPPYRSRLAQAAGRLAATFEVAERHFVRALEKTPNDGAAWADLGRLYLERDPEQALQCAMQANSSSFNVSTGLLMAEGTAALAQTDQDDSERWHHQNVARNQFQHLLRQAPSFCEGHLAYARFLLATQPSSVSLVSHHINKTLALCPEWPPAHLAAARVAKQLQRYEAAEACYDKCISLSRRRFSCQRSGDECEGFGETAGLYLGLRHDEEVHVSAMYELATHLDHPTRMRSTEAKPLLEELYALRPERSDIVGHYGLVLCHLGDYTQAEWMYRKAIEIDANDTHVLNNLAHLLFFTNRIDEAERLWRRAVLISPESPEPKNNLANLLRLHRPDRLEEAKSLYDEALLLRPDAPQLHNNKGC